MGLEEELESCQNLPNCYSYFRKKGKQIGGAEVDYCTLNNRFDCLYQSELVYVEMMPRVFHQFPSCKAMEELEKKD